MQRRLAAIMAADVAGYTRLMEEDEAGTLAALRQLRQKTFEPVVAAHRGDVVKRMGDGWLVEFASVVDAVECAIQTQRDLADNHTLQLRMGVHIGDIVHEDEDIYGDGVNIAARLQQMSAPGGLLVSEDAWRQLKGKQRAALEDAGEQRLKNIADPVRAYRLVGVEEARKAMPAIARGDRPAIAILPFTNMSGDPEQEYFADGITEDLITALSKHRWLNVIARNSTFGYRGQSRDIRRIGAELGAAYVVEGSVRRGGQRVRVTAQLIDAATGNHLWAERYDRDLEDIFEVQDEITDTIVATIEPEVGAAERQKVARTPRKNLRAWDCYHLGIAHFFKFTGADNLEAQRLLKLSKEMDPEFGEAHAWWAYATILGMVYWDIEPEAQLMNEALAATQRALEIDDQNAVFYYLLARVSLARCDYATALSANEMAVKLNPTFAAAYCGLGDSLAYEGRYDDALDKLEKAISLSPNDPQRWAFLTYGALALIFKQDFDAALEWAGQAIVIPNCQYWTTAHMAVALAHLGRQDEAGQAVAKLLAEKPGFTCAFAKRKLFYIKRAEQLALYLDGLRRAGVPEE